MVELVGLLFVLMLSVTLAVGAALAVLGGVLAMMKRTAVRPSPGSLVPGWNPRLAPPVQRFRSILSQPRPPRTARRRALSLLGNPAAGRARSAFRRILTPTATAPHRSLHEKRRDRLRIDPVGMQRMVEASRERVEVAARIGLFSARTQVDAR